MNMKTKDAVYTLGLMLGIGGSYLVLKQAGVESHLLRLVLSLVVGIGIGFVSERVYLSGLKNTPPPPPPKG